MSYKLTSMPDKMSARYSVLLAGGAADPHSAIGRSISDIVKELHKLERPVIECHSLDDVEAVVSSNAGLCCVVVGWQEASANEQSLQQIYRILDKVRGRAPDIPILLGGTARSTAEVPLTIVEQIEGYIFVPEDSAAFIAGRIDAASRRYLNSVLPPFFGALVNFDQTHEYSWHTPGHTGGTAYMKTAVGRAFIDFYGEQMFRSDISISVGETGSLNDHSGPVADSEAYAAKVFGADYTFYVVGGSSASNSIILRSSVADGDIAVVDRNCHKSLNYALNVSGAVPVYLRPRRNSRGVIGPVPVSEISPEAIAQKLRESPLVDNPEQKPSIAALTNSTYDGLCYNIETTTQLLSESVDRIHYDEAWYAYARFNPLYEGRYGMHKGARNDSDATVTATQSTHKCLAALSQASMIHIRSGRIPVDPALFNESFMMYTSTSPQYSLIASSDVAAKMMDDAGHSLTEESLCEAIDFRKAMVRIGQDLEQRSAGDWWFKPWQPEEVDGVPLVDIDTRELANSSAAWVLNPGDSWHGFGDLGQDYCMLDPIKVTVLTPGIDAQGELEDHGIPATLVTRVLDNQGIVVEKTEPYSILTLFTIGTTKGKWGSLGAGYMHFKELYDANAPLTVALPDLVASYPERYQGLGLRELADQMHEAMRKHNILSILDRAFNDLPEPVLTPRAAFARLVKGEVEELAVADAEGRTVAVQIVPYPPGIPLLMPGERFSPEKPAVREYLLGLEAFDNEFPGFEHDTHGVEIKTRDDGSKYYTLYCLKE